MGKIARLRPRSPSREAESASLGPCPSAAVRRLVLRGGIRATDYGELYRTIVGPMQQIPGMNVNLTVEVDGEVADGLHLSDRDPAVRRLREAARRLGFEWHLDVEVLQCPSSTPPDPTA